MSAETVATAEPPRHASLEDKMKELDSVPLFMRDLPTEENTALEALQTLAYDGPPDEVAENFKNQEIGRAHV